MPMSIIIEDGAYEVDAIPGAISNATISADRWIAYPFIAFDNYKLNRIYFRLIANSGSHTVTAGIGTWNDNTYYPNTLAGAGRTLVFDSTVHFTSSIVAGQDTILSIPEIQLIKGQKYFMGFGVTSVAPTSFIVRNIGISYPQRRNNMGALTKSGASAWTPLNGESIYYNWGYDSGSAVTEWYNRQFPGYNNGTRNLNSAGYYGTTLYLNTDFNSLYLDSFRVHIRTPNIAFGSANFGTTHEITLFDSDASTALIAHTISNYSSVISANRAAVFPVKYPLQNKKLYYLAIRRLPSTTDANNNFLINAYDSFFDTGVGLTTRGFVMTTLGSPTFADTKMIAAYRFDIMNGSRQGGIGNV